MVSHPDPSQLTFKEQHLIKHTYVFIMIYKMRILNTIESSKGSHPFYFLLFFQHFLLDFPLFVSRKLRSDFV